VNIVFFAPFGFAPKATVSARMLPMAAALVQRGHRVHLLLPPYDNAADIGKIWQQDGVTLENVAGGSPTILRMAQQMAQRARQLQPDLIHVFKPVGPGALAMWLLQRGKGKAARATGHVPMVVDNDDWEGAGGWLDVNPYPWWQKRVLAWQERWALRHANAITCASDALSVRSHELLGRFDGARRRPIQTICVLPNGPQATLRDEVAQAAAQRVALRRSFGWANERVVIYTGTVPHGHDMDLAVAAFKANLACFSDLRFVIVATGAGLPALRQTVAREGLAERVEWHSFMPHQQLIAKLVAADVAVYPYRDTHINRAKCSAKVIDYMACAKPMVVSDVGMNRVYLRDRESGLLAQPGQVEDFAQALGWLLAHSDEAERMGAAAQQRLWAQFNWNKRVLELETIYENECGRRLMVED
jgi:glycosyltransferase involved in cell wall biosynthesis